MSAFACRAICRAVVIVAMVASSRVGVAGDVVKIEEYWSVAVGGPDAERCAPQVTMVMSPTETTSGDHFVVTLNCHGMPQFCAGGLEVQHWRNSDFIASNQHETNEKLHHDNETVSWVQRLTLNPGSGTLTFEVVDGSSESWGEFGNGGQLRVQASTSLTRLNNYKPAVSLGESGIGYAGNRVSSLVLSKFVWWTDDGERHEMVAPFDIDTDLDP
jgi:hypothetical protein